MTENGDIGAAKKAVRERARAARRTLDPAMRSRAARQLADKLGSLPELAIARTVLAYGASSEELDPSVAVERLRSCGATIAYPRIDEPGVLGLHVVDEETELVAGPFGIAEPPEDSPRIEARDIDAVIVPGVAFDDDCRRIGYGGGYYDRLLPQMRADCARIGVAFDEQLLESIPAEDSDARLDAVVTPSRIVRASRD